MPLLLIRDTSLRKAAGSRFNAVSHGLTRADRMQEASHRGVARDPERRVNRLPGAVLQSEKAILLLSPLSLPYRERGREKKKERSLPRTSWRVMPQSHCFWVARK
jgi:hypothetical protein